MIQLPFDIQRASLEVRSHYIKMVNAGQSPMFAEMCALQQPPGTKGTDRAFQQGRLDGNWLDALPPRQAKKMVREAKAAGIDISGKQYMSGLANKLGHCDPRAWVSDIADVKRVAKDRNLSVSGIVTVNATDLPPSKPVDLNPRIARGLAKQEISKNPGLSMRDALAKVKEKHAPRWKKPAR